MYYFYNRALCGFLTTKGWISPELLGEGSYKLLGFVKDTTARKVTQELFEKYGESTSNMTILLEESNIHNNASKINLSEPQEKIIKNGYLPLVQFLIQRKAQQISSVRLFSSIPDKEKACSSIPEEGNVPSPLPKKRRSTSSRN